MTAIYDWLMAMRGTGAAFDRHIFACVLASGAAEQDRGLNESLGLARDDLAALLRDYFPLAGCLLDDLPDGVGTMALEEDDLAALLRGNGTRGNREEAWLAAIVARRSLGANHLWQDLGLTSRKNLSDLLTRHFKPLAEKNTGDMKWKKFFYRQMCQAEGMTICKSPNCEICDDYALCFGPEDGLPLARQTVVAIPTKGADVSAMARSS